jgi:hypothetical protein
MGNSMSDDIEYAYAEAIDDAEKLLEVAANEDENTNDEISNELAADDIEGSDEGESDLSEEITDVSLDKNDRSLFELHDWYKRGRLIIDPEWQRSYVWSNKKASQLIESFLLDIPIPVIYLAKTKEGKYEVIDGVQRLSSVFYYFEGQNSLAALEFRKELNGKKYDELPTDLQDKIRDTTMRTYELSPKTPKSTLFIIFQRLNTGGVPLNGMEIRNCIYRGKLNNLIKELANFPEFVKCVNQPGTSKRMNDRMMVLRFLAFYEKGYQKVGKGMSNFLNDFLEVHREAPEHKLKEFSDKFKSSMKAAFTIFADQAFRVRKNHKRGGSEWSRKVNATILQIVAVSFTNYDNSQLTKRADAIYEEYIDLVSQDQDWIRCVTTSSFDPKNIRYGFETWNSRLSTLMEQVESLDSERIFSASLKREMFSSNNTCEICGQEIKTIEDAAMDHEVHYWRGGLTVPSNARLVHRLCNLKRPHHS